MSTPKTATPVAPANPAAPATPENPAHPAAHSAIQEHGHAHTGVHVHIEDSQQTAANENKKEKEQVYHRLSQPQPRKVSHPQDRKGSQPQNRKGSQSQNRKGSQSQNRKGSQSQNRKGSQSQNRRGSQSQNRRGSKSQNRKGSQQQHRPSYQQRRPSHQQRRQSQHSRRQSQVGHQSRRQSRIHSRQSSQPEFLEEDENASNLFKLDPEVATKINKLRARQPVAFLSTTDRTYYPEDPGHTKFALAFQAALPDPSLPPPQYYVSPMDDRLDKPISRKGYGMGGLSGPRFAKLHGVSVPAPNYYQKQTKEFLTRQHRFPPQVWFNYGLLGPEDKLWDEKVSRKLVSLWGKCQQINIGFGKSMKEPRFGKTPKWNLVGPGSYPIRELRAPKPLVCNAFMRGPAILNPPTKLHCSYGPKESCLECAQELMGQRDYYRSRYHIDPTPLRPIIEDTEEHIFQAMAVKKAQSEEKIRKRPKRALLCRECYCKALRGESRFWKTRAEVQWLFEKTRHCGYIHQHNGIPEYTLKASCYWIRKLARKEATLSKHYPDKCEKKLVERKQKYQA